MRTFLPQYFVWHRNYFIHCSRFIGRNKYSNSFRFKIHVFQFDVNCIRRIFQLSWGKFCCSFSHFIFNVFQFKCRNCIIRCTLPPHQKLISTLVHIVFHSKKVFQKISIFSKNLAPSVIRISEIVHTMGENFHRFIVRTGDIERFFTLHIQGCCSDNGFSPMSSW